MTHVYHIVQFRDGSAYMIFYGCSWNCTYCIWSFEKWNLCLPSETKQKLSELWDKKSVKFLSVEEIVDILKSNGVKLVFMGGGEPTEDPQIKPLVSRLKDEEIESWLITNGNGLDDELFRMIKGATVSLKALDDDLHRKITGASNVDLLEKIKHFKAEKMTVETVYVKGLVECDEIVKIARFLKSINPQARFRIDPVVGKFHNESDYDEIEECLKKSNEIIYTSMIRPSGKTPEGPKLLYPVIEKTN